MATDGHVGEVDEFIVDPADRHITHLILRKGHFWGHKDVSIPVDQIDRIEADTIYLKLDKHAFGRTTERSDRNERQHCEGVTGDALAR